MPGRQPEKFALPGILSLFPCNQLILRTACFFAGNIPLCPRAHRNADAAGAIGHVEHLSPFSDRFFAGERIEQVIPVHMQSPCIVKR